MSEKVIRLIDRAPVPCGGTEGLGGWLVSWGESIREGRCGEFCSINVVLETVDGQLAILSQSVTPQDRARVIGILTIAATLRANGEAQIKDILP